MQVGSSSSGYTIRRIAAAHLDVAGARCRAFAKAALGSSGEGLHDRAEVYARSKKILVAANPRGVRGRGFHNVLGLFGMDYPLPDLLVEIRAEACLQDC